MNVNDTSVDEILLWVRSSRSFKRRSGKNVHQDTRNMLIVIITYKVILKSVMFVNCLSKHVAIRLSVI